MPLLRVKHSAYCLKKNLWTLIKQDSPKTQRNFVKQKTISSLAFDIKKRASAGVCSSESLSGLYPTAANVELTIVQAERKRHTI